MRPASVRRALPWFIVATASLCALLRASPVASAADRRPNVVIVISDDQGYGDLGVHGNRWLKTPHLDRFAGQSVELTNFHVSPVCSPTRASLMTGRYNYRTGVVDTFLGRSLMFADETTLAEMLAGAGYTTGIFGKWHLGDNYPMRAIDQGFREALVLKGGGLRQPSDPPGGHGYFDPPLIHHGRLEATSGYCSDIFASAAIEFIERNRSQPFFVYLAFNAPHTPLEVPDEDVAPYRQMHLAANDWSGQGHPPDGPFDAEQTAKVYGMIANLDRNFGRLMSKLDELKLADDTMVVFLTDNGPQQVRYNAGLHGRKGSVYEGGIRVPCFVRRPGKLKAGRRVEQLSAHIDLAPTLLQACGIAPPDDVRFDGRSLWPLLTSESDDWPQRTLFFQWHRGDRPERLRACAAVTDRWKLVQPRGAGDKPPESRVCELYDLPHDPFEQHDVAADHPDVVARLTREYEAWFDAMRGERDFALPRIAVGSEHENPVVLTRQDWRGPRAGWKPGDVGHWDIGIARPGKYDITLYFTAATAGTVHCKIASLNLSNTIESQSEEHRFNTVELPAGPASIEAWIENDGRSTGVLWLEIERAGEPHRP
ncbi:MAG TPA: arylsulfatase [Pirellulales bacterium]|nr:arylsulfatase [Pirellulales bacterium]